MNDDTARHIISKIEELTRAVEYLGGPKKAENDLSAADCFVWEPKTAWLQPVPRPNRIDIGLIKGVDHVRDILQENTERFARGYAANNVLLWGARGMESPRWSSRCMRRHPPSPTSKPRSSSWKSTARTSTRCRH